MGEASAASVGKRASDGQVSGPAPGYRAPGKIGAFSRRRAAVVWRRIAWIVGGTAIFARLVAGRATGGLWPGDRAGVICGIAAAVVLAVTALYGVRRRTRRLSSRLKIGTAAAWLQMHLWAGGLFLLLVALHSGPHWPTGAIGWWLWGLSLWVVGGGLLGLLVQRTVPRVLAAGAETEVHFDRIPDLVEDLKERARRVAEAADTPVRTLYTRSLAPAMAAPRRTARAVLDIGGGRRLAAIEHLRSLLDPEEKSRLDELERLYRAKLELDTHFTLQQVLRGWLWIHVPASIFLVLVVLLHIAVVIYY